MLGVGGEAAVGGDHGPLVVEELGASAAEADHRLHRVGLTGTELAALAGVAPVGDVGLLVHGHADAVAGVLLHHREAGRLGHPLDRRTDVGQAAARLHGLDAGRQGRFGDVDQALRLGVDLPHPGREGGITVPALDDGAAVDGDEVALLEPVGTGDPVHDHVVRRRADHGRERRVAVAEEVRPSAPALDDVPADPVELERGDARPDRLADARVHLRHHPPGLAHLGQVVLRPLHALRLGTVASGAACARRWPRRGGP